MLGTGTVPCPFISRILQLDVSSDLVSVSHRPMSVIANPSRRLFNSALWSLSGTVVPMLAALVAVPWLMHHLGQERLGVLSLVWVVVGYFSFLDMGLGRAVTVAVASLRAGEAREASDEMHVLGSASALLLGMGSITALLLGFAIAWVGVPFELSSVALRDEVTDALFWTLPSLPLLLLSSSLRGQLEGVGAFRQLNLVRIPTGILLVAGPCICAFFSPSLIWACLSIFAVRLTHVWVLGVMVARRAGYGLAAFSMALLQAADLNWMRRLLSFGGWVTVSNVIGPVIVYVDRFVIGITLAASAVTVYAVPFDLVSRLPVLVASLCSVLLPELARLASPVAADQAQAAGRARRLVTQSSWLSAAVVVMIVLVGYGMTPWLLRLWLGAEFATQSSLVTQILLVAFGVNALAQIPFTALQAVGKVRALALLHGAELVPYAALVFIAISWQGIVGAAWAWLARSIADYLILAWLWRQHPGHNTSAVKI